MPNELLEVVSWADPALDMTDMERKEYREKRDMRLVRVRPGMQPTRYFIRMISNSHMRAIDDLPTPNQKRYGAFVHGVARIEHAVRRDGSVIPTCSGTEDVALVGGGKVKILTDLALEELGNRIAEDEIGGVAYAHSIFHPGAERTYPPPLLLETAWAQVEQCHAEKIRRDALTSSESHKAALADTAPAPSQPAPDGDAPTAATATE